MEYDVQLNDVIQLMVKTEIDSTDLKTEKPAGTNLLSEEQDFESSYYGISDNVDVQDIHGAWFEGKIIRITKKVDADELDLSFHVTRLSELQRAPLIVSSNEIRPRSHKILQLKDVSVGDTVLVNYNIDNPKTRGYWYDCRITKVSDHKVTGTILFGIDRTPIDNCEVLYVDEIYKIEQPCLIEKKIEIDFSDVPLRKIPFNCLRCKDHPTRKCKECGCKVCFGKNNWEEILLCDECDDGYHIGCLSPPLTEVPKEDEWFCPQCKTDENEIVKAGDKLKFSKKRAKMPSAKEEANARDWGRGMACVGRTKECTIVSKDHIGPIPGIEVGTCWKFRFQVSEAGIHRPLVAGIHGRESSYAYSIVLSGGYEDDIDNGDEFYYTGSGGRDLSGNKRDGAEAEDWKGGKPVRVVRNFKLRKHSNYAPKDGNRYDGIYKVVKYYPEKGKSGFIVWRYLLRRDDPTPAPWDGNGKELEMIYPPGYFEAQASKEKKKGKKKDTSSPPKSKRGAKRSSPETSNELLTMFKKMKTDAYRLENELAEKIANDEINQDLWNECKQFLKHGKSKFVSKVEETFICICCQELVYMPITTTCKHNVCKSCLRRSFAAEIYTCPYCRFELGKDYNFVVNDNLAAVLQHLFPGYEISR
ncbi:hypothetical protein Trydic_g6953 [Trypoxylus dichotomus]